jgi:predicted acetyltransferase
MPRASSSSRPPELAIAPPRSAADLHGYWDVLEQSFPMAFGPDAKAAWLEREPPDGMRLVRRRDRVLGGLMVLDVGQWFGGRSVPMGGIRAVGVRPEARAAGIATRLLRAVLGELHERGTPLSVLYPATQPVYRRLGWEQAGVRTRWVVPTQTIDVRERGLDVEPVGESARADLKRVYVQRARRDAGLLDRDDWCWKRVFELRGKRARGFRIRGPQGTEGYLFAMPEVPAQGRYTLALTDLVVLTPGAGRRALAFFADHRSLAGQVAWWGAPNDPLLTLLGEQRWEVARQERWMLRLVDVAAALAARGWDAGLEGELQLAVRDDILPWNAGRFVLEVCRGRAQVRKGGRGRLRLDVRGLAALYTGYLSPADLRLLGLLEGPDAEAAHAARLFAGPPPWMPDFF